MLAEQRTKIISSYGEILKHRKSFALLELSLPYPKELIRQAIIEEILISNDLDILNALEIAFCELEWSVSQEDYELLKIYYETFNKEIVENPSYDDMNKIFNELKENTDVIEKASQLFSKIQQQSKERIKQLQNIRELRIENKS